MSAGVAVEIGLMFDSAGLMGEVTTALTGSVRSWEYHVPSGQIV
jgi:hypothetical protein